MGLIGPKERYPERSLKLILGLIRPKEKFLGLRLAFVNVWDAFFMGGTVTCDLCPVPCDLCPVPCAL